MSKARKVAILHPDGEMIVGEFPIIEEGVDKTTFIDVEGVEYHLYRYTAFTASGAVHGYVGAPTPLTTEERRRVSCALFGPIEPGILTLEPVHNEAAAAPGGRRPVHSPRMRDVAPAGIVLRFDFSDGVEDVFGERSLDNSVLAQFGDAICAYRFLRPSKNQFLPWVPVSMRDLAHLRDALTHKLEMLTGARSVEKGVARLTRA